MRKLIPVVFILALTAFGQDPVDGGEAPVVGTEPAAPSEPFTEVPATETATGSGESPVFGQETTGETAAEGQETESGSEATSEESPMSCMGTGGGITGFLPIIGMIAIFYFLIIRPQQKQQKKLREMRSTLERGDHVVTGGGIHGVITNLRNDVITVKIADGVKIDVDRNALTVVSQGMQDQESS